MALNENEFVLKDKGLYEIIRHYTREAGVRNLEREISKLCRKVLTHIIKDKKKSVKVDEKNISDLLGVKKFKYGLAEEQNQIGVATGLAWTEVGGDLLSIEAIKLPGKGRMKSTGKLGEVMKESIDAASSFVRSRSPSFGIIPTLFDKYDIHVHVPEGATPKDGPSSWHCHGYLNSKYALRDTNKKRCRYDRRGNSSRKCVANWWFERKTPCSITWGNKDSHHSKRKRERFARYP